MISSFAGNSECCSPDSTDEICQTLPGSYATGVVDLQKGPERSHSLKIDRRNSGEPLMSLSTVLQQNLNEILNAIRQAQERSPNAAERVRLVAVTKYAHPDWVRALSDLHPVFGENRPQQLAERAELLPGQEWHMIGRLQRNKARAAVKHASLIHSIDSLRLLQAISNASESEGKAASVLLQLNLSREEAKSGFSPEEIRSLWSELTASAANLKICGLMTMAAATEDPEDARPTFRELREIRDELNLRDETTAAGIDLSELSMGMSGDFIPAVEEGATLVRVGSRLFAGLPTP